MLVRRAITPPFIHHTWPRDTSTSSVIVRGVAPGEKVEDAVHRGGVSALPDAPRDLLGLASDRGLLDSVRDEAARLELTAEPFPFFTAAHALFPRP
jgi:hypothetical protein